jgi:phosphoribosylaminoimidazole-succinocarboxamide synthase
LKPLYSGKVREIYDISEDRLVIVATDRISAFDHILPVEIKNKGIILNRMSNFWFDKTKEIVKNHIVEQKIENMPAFFQDKWFQGRTVMVEKLQMLPFEFVVRGYLLGSIWDAYKKGKPFCGKILLGHYQMAQKLDHPVITPAIKRNDSHDEYISIQYVQSKLGDELTGQIKTICFKLYEVCSRYAFSRGIIIADAKFEFGWNREGELVLADEIFTPDSSRFWDIGAYKTDVSPKSFDKQFLRDWLTEHQADGAYPFDRVPENILEQTAQIYQECLKRIVY